MADKEGDGNGTIQASNFPGVNFEEVLHQFRASKSHILSSLKCPDLQLPISDKSAYELHADPPPLEQHMEVSCSVRTEWFFDVVAKGDIICGHVRKKLPFALEGQIDTFVGLEKKRFISDLGIRCYLKITELCKSTSDQQVAYQDFQLGDVFKAVVITVDREESRVGVSLREDRLEPSQEDIKLGYEERRRVPSPPLPCRDWDFRSDIDHDSGFHNPCGVRNLLPCVGIEYSSTKSLFASTTNPPYPSEEYSDALKKEQKRNYSMEFTETGIGLMKKGKTKEALYCFNRALQVDGENEETMVAKGALHANAGQYSLAVSDFTQALKTKPHHKNASKYLVETEVTWAQEYVAACAPHIQEWLFYPPLRGSYDYVRLTRDNHLPNPSWLYSQGLSTVWDAKVGSKIISHRNPDPAEYRIQAMSVIAACGKGLMYFQSTVETKQYYGDTWKEMAGFNKDIRAVARFIFEGDCTDMVTTSDGKDFDTNSIAQAIRSREAILLVVIGLKNNGGYSDVRCEIGENVHWDIVEHGVEKIQVAFPNDWGPLVDVFEVQNGRIVDPPSYSTSPFIMSNVVVHSSLVTRLFVLASSTEVRKEVENNLKLV